MKNNIHIKKITDALKALSAKLLSHAKFIFIIIILFLIGLLVFEINRFINKEPTDEQITTQLEIIKRPKIDQETIDKIKQLQDNNVAVEALFKNARDNPFSD